MIQAIYIAGLIALGGAIFGGAAWLRKELISRRDTLDWKPEWGKRP